MLQNSIFDKYLVDLNKEIEERGNGKSLNFKLMIDPSIDLESIKKLSIHDVVRSPLTSSNTVGVIGSINKELDLIKEVLPFIMTVV